MQKISLRLVAALAALILPVLLPTAVHADRLATEKRGISSAAGAFELGNLDSVSLFNGSLTVTVPLGGDYPVGPNFSYRLLAVYNSNGWERDFCGNGTAREVPTPDETDNAGFGWSVHLGRLRRDEPNPGDWTYVSPDGSQHRLYSRLHPGQPASADSNVFYSNDSTYLRMIRYPAGNAACNKPAVATSDCFLMQFPDGGTHEFHRYPADPEDIRLTRMRDSFGNFVDVNYPDTGTSWEIIDQHGRMQKVHFAGPAGEYDRVSRVELTAFDGATATYTFSYDRTSIRRQGISMVSCSAVTNNLFVQLLSRIELPDGSFYL